MNRFTNKEYVIDVTIKTLEVLGNKQPSKVKCEVHYGDDNYLRINLQPILRHGVAQFCDQKLRIPFSSEVDLVFKMVKPNKKETFLGHYEILVERMLSDKLYHEVVREKLEESDAWVSFQCRIIDKQLLCQSESQEMDIEEEPPLANGSIATWVNKKQPKPHLTIKHALSEYNRPFATIKKSQDKAVVLTPEQYCKLVRNVQDVLRKRQIYNKKAKILGQYTRDEQGRLNSPAIQALKGHLQTTRRERSKIQLLVYVIVCTIAFFIGLQL